jgi:hypothetical protein
MKATIYGTHGISRKISFIGLLPEALQKSEHKKM